ncbi:hypothetical protein PoB_007121000 [Plakobranchus ocellatus]|uniref:Uncharacterized protein n=1 Tax=Plakobranchus ocellatus TaxID=259542 RepID=A0AAV4DL48_9GAST|nr:hypothetical protein PoB_007121000 [Plakobranchus ocellatus]
MLRVEHQRRNVSLVLVTTMLVVTICSDAAPVNTGQSGVLESKLAMKSVVPMLHYPIKLNIMLTPADYNSM